MSDATGMTGMADYAMPYLQAWHNIFVSFQIFYSCFNPLLGPINTLDTTKTCLTCLSGTYCKYLVR